jgi:hypothetical protein
LDPNAVAAIRRTIADAFLWGFRLVLFACSGLAVASTLVAWRLIKSPMEEHGSAD